MDAEAKAMLRDGLDAIDFTLRQAGDIAAWQDRDRAARPEYLENAASNSTYPHQRGRPAQQAAKH